MRPNLLLIAPNINIANVANIVVKENGFNCRVVVGNLQQGVKQARIAEKADIEAIISRGGTFLAIQKEVENIPLIPIDVSAYDLLEALYKASFIANTVGVVGYPNTIYDATSVGKYMNLQVVEVPVENPVKLEKDLSGRIKKGLRIIVGDTISVEKALKLGIQGILISSGKRTIYEALVKAEELVYVRRKELLAKNRLEAILDAVTDEGILATDDNYYITHSNPKVREYLGYSDHHLLVGKKLEDLLPDFQEKEELIKWKGQQFLIDTQKIIDSEQEEAGIIVTLKPLKQIQDLETRMRKRLYAKGHVAKHTFTDIVGNSNKIKSVIYKAHKISKSNATVLITGATGTGKEMFAQSIHNASLRADGPFVAVNCASLPESLLESELFGYREGSFTDARKGGKAGLFELAHRGTIFLDEIGDMTLAVQAKVLRVLQEKEVIRLGDDCVIPVDIRIIAAANNDLWEAVKAGKFREDLYYRVNVLSLYLPTLWERGHDVIVLAEKFLHRLNPLLKLEADTLEPLGDYHWPGNVRELYNFMEQLVVLHEGSIIKAENVKTILASFKKVQPQGSSTIEKYNYRELSDEDLIKLLDEYEGNQTKLSEILGINRSTLWRRLKKYKQ